MGGRLCDYHSFISIHQLFEKIMALDIDERHLLRLGHGEEELDTDKDFSRYGRVNFILALRMELLKEVERLQVGSGLIHNKQPLWITFPTIC